MRVHTRPLGFGRCPATCGCAELSEAAGWACEVTGAATHNCSYVPSPPPDCDTVPFRPYPLGPPRPPRSPRPPCRQSGHGMAWHGMAWHGMAWQAAGQAEVWRERRRLVRRLLRASRRIPSHQDAERNSPPRPAPPWPAHARSVCAHAVFGAVAVASVAMCAVRYYWGYRDSVGDAGMADGKHAAHGCTARGTVENVRV